MNWLVGWFREQMSLPVNKLRVLRESVVGGKQYVSLKKFYLSDTDKFFRYADGEFEFHPENWSYIIGKIKMFYVGVDGKQIMFNERAVIYEPSTLRQMFDNNDLSGLAHAVLGGNVMWLWLGVGGVVGGLVGFVVAGFV